MDGSGPGPIADTGAVRLVLIAAARSRTPITYAEALAALGLRFTRPRMRALCRTLDAVDEAAREAGEPALAALVVRGSDGLPGQGWWVARAHRAGYPGAWTGEEAKTFVARQQEAAFAFWAG